MFERVNNVIDQFGPYMHLEQIVNLADRVKTIKNELSVKVKAEFEDTFSNPFTKVGCTASARLYFELFFRHQEQYQPRLGPVENAGCA